jgi:hypothetical protein
VASLFHDPFKIFAESNLGTIPAAILPKPFSKGPQRSPGALRVARPFFLHEIGKIPDVIAAVLVQEAENESRQNTSATVPP